MSGPQDPQSRDSSSLPCYVGVDVGGTGIKLGVLGDSGAVLAASRVDTLEARGPRDAIGRIRQALDGLLGSAHLDWEHVAAIGLGTPGTMDIPRGYLLDPPNLPHWAQFPIRDELSQACGRPVVFANDGAAAAYGEYWLGSGKAFSSMVMLTLGTGVGGGIIVGNRSIDGAHSHGAECGHIIIDSSPDARVCSCGQTGHLEAYASATGVVKRAIEAIEAGRPTTLRDRLLEDAALDGLAIAGAAEAGDAVAEEIVLETADYLARGIVSLVHTIDPEGVVLGGAMNFGGVDSALGRRFLERIREGFRRRTFPVLAERTRIEFASLGGDAGFLGAAGLARAAFH